MVNPTCTYSYGDSRKGQHGVAIILKELLQLLDRFEIEHADESTIRRELRKRGDCKTSANQFFLTKKSKSTLIDRKKGDTRNVSCVIIPSKDVPDSFFEALEAKGNASAHNFIIH